MMTLEERVMQLRNMIEAACVACGLNITIYDRKLGFVDQSQRKIVAVWNPQFKAPIPDNVVELSKYLRKDEPQQEGGARHDTGSGVEPAEAGIQPDPEG